LTYAILDIETTGGSTEKEAITEIAVFRYDGNKVIDQFSSLVNPECPIQPFVVKLTGINNKMLRKAPKFYEIAKRLVEITDGCVIVAHNAAFDYRVLRKEFSRLGYKFERPTLCTVETSRALIPDMPSYSLGKLCRSLHIPMSDRHRATGDARATLELFKLLLNKQRNMTSRIKYPADKKSFLSLSGNLVEMIENLPTKKGILYLYNHDNELIAVKHSGNIKSKFNRIFTKNNPKSVAMQREIKRVDYELLSGNLINRIVAWTYRDRYNPKFTPCIRKNGIKTEAFSNNSMLLVDKGHHIGEKSLIYIENQKVIGFGFFELEWQKQNISILKDRLTKLEDKPSLRKIIQDYLKKYRVEQIIRFDE